MAAKLTYRLLAMVLTIVLSAPMRQASAAPDRADQDTSKYPLTDRRGDPYTYGNRNPFDFKDTAFISRKVEYDPVTKQYYVIEKIGTKYYRTPATFSQEEFIRMQGKVDETDYFRQRANALSNLNRRNFKPKFDFSSDWMNRITGNGKVEIRPSGYVDLSAGYQGQFINNPTLPERARRNGGFDFNQNAQLQVDAKIGDKINLPINYNTLANFDFENQLKLDYTGKDDEILKQFQAGNVSFSNRGTLIPGAQSLFGVRTQLQFGKLFVTTVLANQRSQRQTANLQGGSATQQFSLRADEYEENRHFLLGQYFRSKYNDANKNLPQIKSNINILRVEVWVTNRLGIVSDFQNATGYRDIVAFMDMGESNPFRTNLPGGGLTGSPDPLPRNNANDLFQILNSNPSTRNSTEVQGVLTSMGFQPVQDFEKTFARKLQPTDFIFQPLLGYISLNSPLQPDEVLGVAYQYTYNGKVYQVGEFSQDVPPDSTGNSQKVLFLKLLKATSQRTNLPIWDLMMKNVYSVGFGQLERNDFRLDITYEEPSLGDKRYLPISVTDPSVQPGTPLLTLTNLDRLNNQNDPVSDGIFDYLEGITVIPSQSRIIFPVLEPFGKDLEFAVQPADRANVIFYPLYDTIKAIAQTYAQLNRYKLVGRSRSASNQDYQLGFNIPRGSVTVTAGGQVLQEGVDYDINYDLGTLHINNSAVIQSGIPVQIQFENNATFGFQQRNYMGLRLDYMANRHLSIGGTVVRMSERPFFTKQAYGEDPIRNTMYGLDFDFRDDVPRLTKWLNRLPFYSTKAMSSISAYGEAALLDPGHASQIGKGDEGVIYLDDFEGTKSSIDLRFPLIAWTHASVPQNAKDSFGNILFPEASLINDLASGANRAKLAWYNIEPVLQERNNSNNPFQKNLQELSKPETRQVLSTEIFPQRTNDLGQNLLTTFDLSYYPQERGPYNFRTNGLTPNGFFTNPKKSWGGLMRNIDQTDFESSNIEFIEFWLQNPFINNQASNGGELYINIGNISEDILRDGKRQYENGLPTPTQPDLPVDSTVWGRIPRNPIQVTNAFSNDPNDRIFQDIGFDGLQDADERIKYDPFIQNLATQFGTTSPVYQNALNDPSGDNFKPYRDPSFDTQPNDGILRRYKDINNPHGNSPVANEADEFTNAFTLYPDQEELNRDNTLNEVEEYFSYRVVLKPGMDQTNNKHITDVRKVKVRLADGNFRDEEWYLFRIPVKSPDDKVGNIPDLKSVRFIRMFLTNFEDTAVLRFAKLELVRNQWRKFNYQVNSTGVYVPLPANDPIKVDILAVNLEENDRRTPIPYVQPPGIERQQQISNNNTNLLLNEQSLSLRVNNLLSNDPRGVFKTMNLDLRQYGSLRMFIHAEDAKKTGNGNTINKDQLHAIMRLGNDFVSNYYEVRIPLAITPWDPLERDSTIIWPDSNYLDFDLDILTNLKMARNIAGASGTAIFDTVINGKTYSILGNPNLGEVRGMFLGVENTQPIPVDAEIWFNELRLSKLDEKGGYAALGRVDIRLADLGSINLSGSFTSIGWGTLEQKVNERSRETRTMLDATANLELGKLLPRSLGMQIPVFASINKTISTPEYDPYDLDIKLNNKLDAAPAGKRDSIRNDAVDELTTKTIGFTNVKKLRTNNKTPKPWDISNLDLNFVHTHSVRTNPIIERDDLKRTVAGVGYTYQPAPKFIEPLKGLIKTRSPWLALIRDFNFNLLPFVSIQAKVERQFNVIRNRNVGTSFKLPENFNKYWYFDRFYTLRWELTRSLILDFSAQNNARVDEPLGYLNTPEKKKVAWDNFWKGGRNTHYSHDATLSYTLPTAKIPLLDWTQANVSYTAKYDWIASSLLTREFGNFLDIGQEKNGRLDLDFERLYTKFNFLRGVYSDAPPPPKTATKDTTVKRKKNPGEPPYIAGVPKFLLRMATSLKRVNVTYVENLGTLLPGYMDSTRVLGMNIGNGNPGWKYVMGYQPDTSDINELGRKGLLSTDSLFNAMIQQNFNQTLNITAQVSPIRDLNIDLTWTKTFTKNYSELYKDTTGGSGLTRLNPYATGSFSISYISYQTLFDEFDPNRVSETFKQFEANRLILSKRLAAQNPYTIPVIDPSGYIGGYGRYAQDVVIPSFLAAYTGKDPNTIGLIRNDNPSVRSNPFRALIPKPNWNVIYSGLSRIPGLEKLFTNFTIRHGYNSTLSMNQFNSALLFQDRFRFGYPEFVDTANGNFIPYYLIPNITISESFSPLLGVDVTLVNQMSFRFEYKKSRQLSLSLVDYQLAENQSTEYSFGFDWRKRGVLLFGKNKPGKDGKTFENDLTFRMDFSLRDDATANSKLDQNNAFGTAGQKVIRIAPSIDYVMNQRVNVKLYFEQNKIIPKIATSAPITNTRAGVQVRISLAQ